MARGDDKDPPVKTPTRRPSTRTEGNSPSGMITDPKTPGDSLPEKTRSQEEINKARSKRDKALAKTKAFDEQQARKIEAKTRAENQESSASSAAEAQATYWLNREAKRKEELIEQAGRQDVYLGGAQLSGLIGGELIDLHLENIDEPLVISKDDLKTFAGQPFDINKLVATETSPAEVAFVGDIAITV